MSTYVTVDIHEDVWLRCNEHPRFERQLAEGSSTASIESIIQAHNAHAKEDGCGSALVPGSVP